MRIYSINDASRFAQRLYFNFYCCKNVVPWWQFCINSDRNIPGFYNHKKSVNTDFSQFIEKDLICENCKKHILAVEEVFTFVAIYKLSGEVGLNNYLLSCGFKRWVRP